MATNSFEAGVVSVIVVVEGGCVSDVLTDNRQIPLTYDVWDWDNFNDDPLSTWEGWTGDRDAEDCEALRSVMDPSVYAGIKTTLAEVRAEEKRQREEARQGDAFWMVERVVDIHGNVKAEVKL